MRDIIFGRNVVKEALKSDRNVREIYVSKKSGGLFEILELAKKKSVVVKFLDPLKIRKYGEKTQGVVAFCDNLKFFTIPEILQYAKEEEKLPFFLICDGIKDPHNLGALMRTAYAVGVCGIILPKRKIAPINAVVAKASAGTINFLKIAITSNIVDAIKRLKKEGIFVYCADCGGENFYKTSFKGPVALVVGSEEKGCGALVKKTCDGLIKIPMKNELDSLNVSVAGGIIMYEMLKQNSN